MKKTILLFVFILCLTNSFAQTNDTIQCHTLDVLTHDMNFNRSIQTVPYDATTPYVINVFFTLLEDSPGNNVLNSQGAMVTNEQVENAFLDCIRILNIAYSPHKIYFKYTGYQRVVNNDYNTGAIFLGTPADWQKLAQNKQPEALNIFVGNNGGGDYSVIGGIECLLPLSRFSNTNPVFHQQLTFFLIHDVGHNLSLYHTFETGNHYAPQYNIVYACERVTRDNTDPLFNADFAGDEVVDTPAQPQYLNSWNFESGCGNYIFDPNSQNCFTEAYQNIIANNYMGTNYAYTPVCPFYFSSGQVVRMRKFIQHHTGIYGNTAPTVRNDVSSLYEPFNITGGGQTSTAEVALYSKTITPNEVDTGINVWNCGPFTMRFQPGLDCEFSSLPNTVTQTANDQFNGVCNGDFIGVKIPVFGQQIIKAMAPVCFGTFEPYTSGEVKSTTNLASLNYTIEELDKIKATDPELFEKLQAERYHIITKQTDSGYIDQKIIYKN